VISTKGRIRVPRLEVVEGEFYVWYKFIPHIGREGDVNSGKSSNDVVLRCANVTLSKISTVIVRGDKLYYTGGSTGLEKVADWLG
jgi:hypothetical protein